jgi:bifunctional non-homologous end joining protein LigD
LRADIFSSTLEGVRQKSVLEVDGRSLEVTNLDKVLYPASGTTKAEVINYYIRISPWLLPHLKDRPLTLKRYPEGVEKEHFYEKNAPRFRPEWIETFPVPHRGGRSRIDYILVNDLATLVWTANLANLELHTFLARVPTLDRPTMVVFDLDPGAPAGVLHCAEVALLLRELMDALDLECRAKSSGSKGIQVYVPLNTQAGYDQTRNFAHEIAKLLEKRRPDLVVSTMAKQIRTGKVFIDWSQNAEHKSTVTAYSLRARTDGPAVSIPLSWKEVEKALRDGDEDAFFPDQDQAVRRAEKSGDLFEPVLTLSQEIPDDYVERLQHISGRARAGASSPPARGLGEYRKKRDFARTAEPPPSSPGAKSGGEELMFVIQKHQARRLHYDLRLEMEGVLRSWAVPKGVPTERKEKRLAVHVEDHPMDYARFEGTIPEGNYGAGTVMVWDMGTWEARDGHPVGGFYRGELPIVLHGRKLMGEWTLVRRGGGSRVGKADEWLLLKTGRDIRPISVPADDRSVLTGRTMEQIRGAGIGGRQRSRGTRK